MDKSIPENGNLCMKKPENGGRRFCLETLLFFTLPSATFTQIFFMHEKSKSEECASESSLGGAHIKTIKRPSLGRGDAFEPPQSPQ